MDKITSMIGLGQLIYSYYKIEPRKKDHEMTRKSTTVIQLSDTILAIIAILVFVVLCWFMFH